MKVFLSFFLLFDKLCLSLWCNNAQNLNLKTMREYLIYSKKVSNGDLNFMAQVKASSKQSALDKYEKANRKIKYPVVITKNNVVEGSLWK